MRRHFILLAALLAAVACRQAEDTRYFAPAVEFGNGQYAVSADDGGLDVDILLSRPATQAFSIGLNVNSSLEEGVQYRIAPRTVDITPGQQEARVHVDLVDDEIWAESSWIELILKPGERYTLDPGKNSTTRVDVSKVIKTPIFRLIPPQQEILTNPFLAETFRFQLESDRNTVSDVDVELDFDGLEYDKDYRIIGSRTPGVTYPAGARSFTFEVEILKKDQSGYDRQATLSVVPGQGRYAVDPDHGSADFHLYDPVVDLRSLFRTGAQAGEGYQLRQAILAADGETWSGNLAANFTLSEPGSSYVKSLRNMGTTYGCLSNEVGLHALRLADFFPNLRSTSGDAILDYGRNNNTRGFSPVDSLFRFVLDPGSTTEGRLILNKPRTFTAFIGDYNLWKNAWEDDTDATDGNIFASVSPIITGRVDVVLEKLDGRFNLSDAGNALLFTAWFSCDSPYFMQGVDFDTLGAVREDGLWKVRYKIWPR